MILKNGFIVEVESKRKVRLFKVPSLKSFAQLTYFMKNESLRGITRQHTRLLICKETMSGKSHTASDAFLGSLTSMTNDEDMQGILDAQNHMLGRFEKTNEMLSNFNSLSSQRYDNVQQQFNAHTQLLLEMKADLDIIFRRLRTLKVKLARDYPRAFTAASKDERKPDLGEDEESLSNTKTDSHTGTTKNSSSDSADAAEKVQNPEKTIVDKDNSGGANSSKNSEPPIYLVD